MRQSTSRDRRSGVQSRLSGPVHAPPPTSDASYQRHRRVSPQGKLSAGVRDARCGAPYSKLVDKMPVHVNRRYKQRRRVLVLCRRTPLRGQVRPTLVQTGAWIVFTIDSIYFRSRPALPLFRHVCRCRRRVPFGVRVVRCRRTCALSRVCAVLPRPNFAEARPERRRRGDANQCPGAMATRRLPRR